MSVQPLSDTTFIAFDIETTGLYPMTGRLIELAAVKFQIRRGILATFDQLINPRVTIPEEAVRVHGITDELVADKPFIEQIMPRFLEFIGDPHHILLAHNASFDAGFIGVEMARLGMADPGNLILDTLVLSRHYLPGLGRYSLDHLARALNICPERPLHRALTDSMIVKEVFLHLLERHPEIETIEQLQEHTYCYHFSEVINPDIRLPPGYETLTRAIEDGLPVIMTYQGGSKGTAPRTITPLAIMQRNGIIYLVAYCHLDRVEKAFRLDRIARFSLKEDEEKEQP